MAFCVTCFVILPGAFAFLLVYSQPSNCIELLDGHTSGACTPLLLGTIKIVGGIGLCLGAVVWLRFLKRLTDSQEEALPDTGDEHPQAIVKPDLKPGRKEMGFGQVMLIGRIEEARGHSHNAVINDESLDFLSVYPFQKGWLNRGDTAAVVYQCLRWLNGSKLVLAYYSAGGSVRGASAWVYSAWVPLFVACIIAFARWKPYYGQFMIAFCSVMLVLDLAYLALMLRARTILKSTFKHQTGDRRTYD